MFVDNNCESESLSDIKADIKSIISSYKSAGVLKSASVYLKEYRNNEWISINESELFWPGSLMKVPTLITILKMNESNPGLLNRKLTFNQNFSIDKKVNIDPNKSIVLGHKYTVKQLLTYMIVNSDNNATLLLATIMDPAVFNKVYTDIGLTPPDWSKGDFPINVKDFSLFMRILYNGCYLSNADSEFAIGLLARCDYMNGIMKGIPSSITVAHKFGEAGDLNLSELHESGIVFINDNPYLLTIMTKGPDLKKLPDVLQQVSTKVYQYFSSHSI